MEWSMIPLGKSSIYHLGSIKEPQHLGRKVSSIDQRLD